MNTRSLTGWLLIAGPVLTFVVVGLLYPAMVGEQETPQTSVAEMMAAPELARVLLVIGSMVFASTFIGLALLGRSMQGENKSGTAYATVATIIFAGLVAIAIAATGMSQAALEATTESTTLAVTIEAIGTAMFAGLWLFWGIGSLILGSAMLMQKNLHVAVGWLFVIFGAFVVITSLVELDLPDAVGLVVWVTSSLVHVAAGVLTLRQQS